MDDYYDRQVTFIGKDAQAKLQASKVLIVGLGGLGTVVAQTLARMGVGTLVLFDSDVINTHNLSRQQLYTTQDVGNPKVKVAKQHLSLINPQVAVTAHDSDATLNNLQNHKDVNLVIDCTDRQASRRIIDQFCSKNNISWVHGAAIQDKGTVCVFQPTIHPEISFDRIYKNAHKDIKCVDCGVLATTTNLIGTLQSHLAINLLLSKPVPSGLFRFRLDSMELEHIKVV